MTTQISFQRTFQLLENAMDVARQRHSLMVGNVSNLDTPGYKAKDIDFKAAMQKALAGGENLGVRQTDPGHIGPSGGDLSPADVHEEEGVWNGYNWMNVDRVVTKMTENNLIYRTATEALLRKIALMKEVIREGGR